MPLVSLARYAVQQGDVLLFMKHGGAVPLLNIEAPAGAGIHGSVSRHIHSSQPSVVAKQGCWQDAHCVREVSWSKTVFPDTFADFSLPDIIAAECFTIFLPELLPDIFALNAYHYFGAIY